MDVATDSMTLRAVASFESLNLSGHMANPRIQSARFKATLTGRIWKTMTQIILIQSQPLYGIRFCPSSTYFEPAQTSPVVLGLIFHDTKTLEVYEEVIPAGFPRRDIEYEEVEHCDESEAFVELGKWVQEP